MATQDVVLGQKRRLLTLSQVSAISCVVETQ